MTEYSNYQFPWREGNRFEILVDGPEFFPRMLDSIEKAEHFVLMEMYLFESGSVAGQFINAWLNAAKRGVKIFLLFDDYGSMGLKKRDRDLLIHPNIQLHFYNPLNSYSNILNLYRIVWRHVEHILYRDHRKLMLVDDKVAYVGGAGITDEFAPPHSDKRWRETQVEIRGPVLVDWFRLFSESWSKCSEEPLGIELELPSQLSNGQPGRVTVNEIHHRSGTQRSLYKRIHNAEHRIWFATAYFIPPWRVRRKLKRAARSGVDVRLLLPGPITDHPGVRHASHRYYSRLLRNGVRIFEYQPRFFHAKTVLCDYWVTIGSSNFDRWNLQWNLEANQEIEDQEIADKVIQMFENDYASSIEYTYDTWRKRSRRSRLLEWFWEKVEFLSMKIRANRHGRGSK